MPHLLVRDAASPDEKLFFKFWPWDEAGDASPYRDAGSL
jgi:hypothetical protein